MGNGWSNKLTTSLTLPTGATTGARIVLDGVSDTILVYSATGALVASVAAVAGTDRLGNSYPAGFMSFSGTNTAVIINNGRLSFGITAAGEAGDGFLENLLSTGGGVSLFSGFDAGSPDGALIALTPGTNGASSGTVGAPLLGLTDDNNLSPADINLSGTVIKTTNAGTRFTWQTPSYNANWVSGTSFNGTLGYHALQYRLDAEDNVHIVGTFAAGAIAPGMTVFTLPAGYRPTANQPAFAMRNNAGTLSTGEIIVRSSGNVDVNAAGGLGIAANNEYLINAVIPLNNIP